MSHITDMKTTYKDLDALAEAGDALGFELVRGKTEHAWYGKFMNDSAEGRRVVAERGLANLGKCDHVLRLKGHQPGDYEIGLVAQPDGSFKPYYDQWGPGQKLLARVGSAADPSVDRLKQEYAVAAASRRARAKLGPKGWKVERKNLPGGRVKLIVKK